MRSISCSSKTLTKFISSLFHTLVIENLVWLGFNVTPFFQNRSVQGLRDQRWGFWGKHCATTWRIEYHDDALQFQNMYIGWPPWRGKKDVTTWQRLQPKPMIFRVSSIFKPLTSRIGACSSTFNPLTWNPSLHACLRAYLIDL